MIDDGSRIDLRPRAWTAAFLSLALVLLVGGYGYYRGEAERIRQGKYQDIAAIGALKAGQIREWRQERLADARRSAASPFFQGGGANGQETSQTLLSDRTCGCD